LTPDTGHIEDGYHSSPLSFERVAPPSSRLVQKLEEELLAAHMDTG
jgi:hypothetical protein